MAIKVRPDLNPFDDIRVVGITTASMDYQMASYLNKTLHFEFVKCDNIFDEVGEEYSFYLYTKGENSNTFDLVAMVSDNGRERVSFKPKTDYLFIVRGYMREEIFSQILNKIKNIPCVFHAYLIDTSSNKKIYHFLEDIENHEIDILDTMSDVD